METNSPEGQHPSPPPPPPPPGPVPPPQGGGADLVYPENPPRDPIVVLVLNLLVFGGVGYIVMGQKTKGIVAIIAWFLLMLPPSCGTLSGLVALLTAIDGYLQAQHLQQGKPVGQWTFFNDHR